MLFYPIHTANLNAINAMGRSDYFLKLEIAKKVIGMLLLLLTMRISVMAMAYSLLVSMVTSMMINSWPNKKLLKYSFKEQIIDILPNIFIVILMGGMVSTIYIFKLSDVMTLAIQIPLGAIAYIGLSIIFKIEEFQYLKNMAEEMFKGKKK